MLGREGQAEAAHYERAALEAASRIEDLIARQAETDRRRDVLIARAAHRDLWHEERVPQILARLEGIEHEVGGVAPLTDRPGPELAATTRTLTDALERSRPPDPHTEVARLRLLSRSGREDARRLRAMIVGSEQAVDRLHGEQAAAGRQLRAPSPALERRERWERELVPALWWSRRRPRGRDRPPGPGPPCRGRA
jgi:hypothetical protein